MKVGLIADSHDNLWQIQKAVDFFNEEKVDFVLHAGDFVAPFTIPKLKSLKCDFQGVFGNNDGEKEGLARTSQDRIKPPPLRIKLDNRKITIVHDISMLSIDNEGSEIIVFGHTHRPQIKKESGRLLINPGECGGWLSGESTVATIDLSSLTSQIIKL